MTNRQPIYSRVASSGADHRRDERLVHQDRDDDGIPIDPNYKTSEIPQLMLRKYGGKVGITGDSKQTRNPVQQKHDNDRRIARRAKRKAEKEAYLERKSLD